MIMNKRTVCFFFNDGLARNMRRITMIRPSLESMEFAFCFREKTNCDSNFSGSEVHPCTRPGVGPLSRSIIDSEVLKIVIKVSSS